MSDFVHKEAMQYGILEKNRNTIIYVLEYFLQLSHGYKVVKYMNIVAHFYVLLKFH